MTAPPALSAWLAWLRAPGCPCRYAWKTVGGIGDACGPSRGWVRMTSVADCAYHGTAAGAEDWRDRRRTQQPATPHHHKA